MKLRSLLLLTAAFQMRVSYAQTRQQVENLYTFARLYGYVRYFHPSDAVVVTDWDRLAIYGAQQVAQASDQKALQQTLKALFHPIAPTLQIYPTGSNPPFNRADISPADTSHLKAVCWQYNGYGLDGGNGYFESARTNSYIKRPAAWPQGNFSTISASIDARPYQGRKIRYSAAVRAEDLGEGRCRLWVRIDRANHTNGLFDNMGLDAITGVNKHWRRYTVAGKVDPDAENIHIGCYIANKGRILIDDIKLEVQTEHGWETVKAVNGSFETDSIGVPPAFWEINNSDRYLTVKTTDQQAMSGRHALYLERTSSVAGIERSRPLFRHILPAGTVVKKDIGSGLSITMPVSLWGDETQTYPKTDTAQLTRSQRAMMAKLPSSPSADNLYVRLADIMISWNVLQHFHPYYAERVTNWDADLRAALQDCYKDSTARAFGNTLKRFVAKLHDGHISINSPDLLRDPAFLPVKWDWVEEQLVVTRVLRPDIPLAPGDVITAINGVPAADYIREVAQTISAPTPEASILATLGSIVMGESHSSMMLSVVSTGKTSRQVKLSFDLSFNEYLQHNPDMKSYLKIDTGLFYVNLLLMSQEELETRLPELSAAKAVIFDLRGTPADESPRMVLNHLLQEPEHAKWTQRQQIMLPDHENTGWDGLSWNLAPLAPRIGGRVIFLTDGRAVGYAESIMGIIKGLKLATIIGEPTAGINGGISYVSLPGGYSFYFTGTKVTNYDGSQYFMKGIQPDITVHRTVKAIREGRDEELDKAIEISK